MRRWKRRNPVAVAMMNPSFAEKSTEPFSESRRQNLQKQRGFVRSKMFDSRLFPNIANRFVKLLRQNDNSYEPDGQVGGGYFANDIYARYDRKNLKIDGFPER